MKKIITILALTTSMSVFAVEGYSDIYLDKKMDLIVHGLMCGEDLNNLNRLKPAVVFTNTAQIEKGTYYYKSAYGEYSYTFNHSENDAVMVRGLLALDKINPQQSLKEQMVTDLCIVKDIEGLPEPLRRYLTKTTLKADDASREQTMKNFEMVSGKPAYGKGEY
tara:strand:+ start:33435 stop:33926 length:492 start_codon:yes stop_codon:yes gene_type:complete